MSKYFAPYLKYTFFISLAIYFVDQGVGWLDGQPIGSLAEEIKNFGVYFLYGLLIGGANIYLVAYLDKQFSWQKDAKKRLIIGLAGAIVVSLIAIFMARLILTLLSGYDLEYFLTHQKVIHYFYSLIITLIVVFFFHAFYFYKALSEKKVSESEFVAKTESAKYESLKSQLDPHFLFNSLNVLTSLIGEDPAKAELFTTKLSKVYRYVLEQKDKDLIALKEELNFAKTYMALLTMRFEEAVIFELPTEDFNSEYKMVPLSLQILLENAVKHNVINKENPLTIRIYLDNGCLCVDNKIQLKSVLKKSTRVGLKNIIERYALITHKKVEVVKTESEFKVRLPLLTQKIKFMKTSNTLENTKYLRAVERVEEIKGFYTGLLAFCIVIPFLIYINLTYTPDFYWFWFPIMGWGIGLTFHAFKAFGYNTLLGHDWESRKIQEYMKEEDKQYWK